MRFLFFLVLICVCGCSPKLPLKQHEGDRVKLRLVDGDVLYPILLLGDQENLWILSEDTLYLVECKTVDYIKILGYNETETYFYTIPSALTVAIGATSMVTTFSAPGLTLIGLGTLGLVLGASSSKKFRFSQDQADFLEKLRLHFRYPQGLTMQQKQLLLERYGQPEFKRW